MTTEFDEAYAQIFRKSPARTSGVTEEKIFGELGFLLRGNMRCRVHKDGGMARVGKDREAAALRLEGVAPLAFTGRRMDGVVDLSSEAFESPGNRGAILTLAFEFAGR